MTVGERIRREREYLGISQTNLAKKVGVSKQTLYKYETNVITNIPSNIIENIATVLNISPCILMGWTIDYGAIKSTITNSAVVQGNNASTLIVKNGIVHEHEISDQAVELIRIFELLNVKEQTKLLSFAFELEEKHNKEIGECQNEKT